MRFSNFTNAWSIFELKDLVKFGLGLTHTPTYKDSGVAFISSKNISGDKLDLTDINYVSLEEYSKMSSSVKPQKGDILFTRVGSNLGHPVIYDGNIEIAIFVSLGYLRCNNQVSNCFIKHWMNSNRFWSQVKEKVGGSSKFNLNTGWISKFTIGIPNLEEQTKISFLLNKIDERIETQNKIIEGLKSSIKAILDCFFAHETNSKIGNYITEVSERNKNDFDYPVFSVSNKKGFIPQQEQFEDKVIASDDKSSYKIVRKNMFAYNPARINVGSIDLYELDSPCIVSPMYNCFGVKEIDPMYLSMYFKSSFFINEMSKRLEGSVRMCLTMNGLKNLPIYIPSMNEMNRLINVYLVITRKLQNSTKLLNLYLKQKDYLLSNLFI